MAVERQILQPAKTEPSNIVAAPRVPNTLSPIGEGLQDLGRAIAITSKELRERRERADYGRMYISNYNTINDWKNRSNEAAMLGEKLDFSEFQSEYDDMLNNIYDTGLPSSMVASLVSSAQNEFSSVLINVNKANFKADQIAVSENLYHIINTTYSIDDIMKVWSDDVYIQTLLDYGMSKEGIDKIFIDKMSSLLSDMAINNPTAFLERLEAAKTKGELGDTTYTNEFTGIHPNYIDQLRRRAEAVETVNQQIDTNLIADEAAKILYDMSMIGIKSAIEREIFDEEGDVIGLTKDLSYIEKSIENLSRDEITAPVLASLGFPYEDYTGILLRMGVDTTTFEKLSKSYSNMLSLTRTSRVSQYELLEQLDNLDYMVSDINTPIEDVQMQVLRLVNSGFYTPEQGAEALSRKRSNMELVVKSLQKDENETVINSSTSLSNQRSVIANLLGQTDVTGGFRIIEGQMISLDNNAIALFSSTFRDLVIYRPPKEELGLFHERREQMGYKAGGTEEAPYLQGYEAYDYVYRFGGNFGGATFYKSKAQEELTLFSAQWLSKNDMKDLKMLVLDFSSDMNNMTNEEFREAVIGIMHKPLVEKKPNEVEQEETGKKDTQNAEIQAIGKSLIDFGQSTGMF